MRVLENIEVSLAGCENSLQLFFAQNHEDIPSEGQNFRSIREVHSVARPQTQSEPATTDCAAEYRTGAVSVTARSQSYWV
jgi:hypothetical protein